MKLDGRHRGSLNAGVYPPSREASGPASCVPASAVLGGGKFPVSAWPASHALRTVAMCGP